jgi:hypothetical protein
VGVGTYSGPSAPVVPATVPGAPAVGTVTPGDGRATLTWTAPYSGGSAVTASTVEAVSVATGKVVAQVTTPGSATSGTVSALTNGKQYVLRVRAANVMGAGAVSAASVVVIPRTVPGAPVIGSATDGVTTDSVVSATAAWALPATNGGSVVTGYVVTADRAGGSAGPTGLTRVVGPGSRVAKFPGLTAGATYRFRVQATNAAGTGPSSAPSNLVTAR